MNYRYQETLSWIIPGIYFIFSMIIFILCIFPESEAAILILSIFKSDITAGSGAVIVFAVPVFSFIIGWIINGYAGYLFRFIMKSPTTDAYNDVFSTNAEGKKLTNFHPVTEKQAEATFDIARRVINLENVDRFYYRYVASRNMFVTQCFICILLIFALNYAYLPKLFDLRTYLIIVFFTFVSLGLAVVFYFIVSRDLNTHAKYVLLRYKELTNKKKDNKSVITIFFNPTDDERE